MRIGYSMMKDLISWWLFSFIWITTSFYDLNAQSLPPVELVTEEHHPYFGSLRLHPSWTDLDIDSIVVFAQYPEKSTLPMLGQWKKETDQYYFLPRFPFRQGKIYWVKWRHPNGEQRLSSCEIPIRSQLPSPSILGIYPSADRWPANQLKFYLQFDQPMREGVAMQYIQLIDEHGEVVERPFLEMGQELWDKDHRRLTVWFDPGRIKTGLIPNEKYGPPLQADRIYQLNIKAGFPAKNGQLLSEPTVKTFHTSSKDQERPDPRQWELHLPDVGTHQAVNIEFPEPLDFGLLKVGLWVEDASGQVVGGEGKVGPGERSWHWIPNFAWTAGYYYLRIDEDLEDLAGNNLQRLFDTFIQENKGNVQQLPTSLKFEVLEQH